MFFLPIQNLPVEVREKYLRNLRANHVDTQKNKEISELKKIISTPPTSLSIKNMMAYSYAFKRLKELQS
jgi:hypothetical protein